MSKKRFLLTIISILIAVIIVSLGINFVLLKYNIISVKDITLGTDKVIISKLAEQQIIEIYPDDLITEVPTCLAGEISEKGIRIDNVERAIIVEATERNVTYVQCKTRVSNKFGTFVTQGTLHNHPNNVCHLSDQDITTYIDDTRQGQQIMGLKCDGNYVFYILSKLGYEVEKW